MSVASKNSNLNEEKSIIPSCINRFIKYYPAMDGVMDEFDLTTKPFTRFQLGSYFIG